MNLQQFYYFKAIASTLNYTKAADKLYVTQSSLSHSIADLEKELSVPLFNREGRHIYLTKYGQMFLTHVNNIINEIDIAVNELQFAKNSTFNTVKIMMAHNSAAFFSRILQFLYQDERNVSIHFDISEGIAQDMIEELHNHSIDLGFSAKINTPDIEFFPVFTHDLVLLTPLDHPLSQRDNVDIAELDKLPLITFKHSCGTRHYIDSILKEYNINPVIVFEAELERMIASVVVSGLGVALVPNLSELADFSVKITPVNHGEFKRPIYMMWLKNQELHPAARIFKEHVVEYCKNNTNLI